MIVARVAFVMLLVAVGLEARRRMHGIRYERAVLMHTLREARP